MGDAISNSPARREMRKRVGKLGLGDSYRALTKLSPPEIICALERGGYLSGPRAEGRRDNLRTWFPQSGTESANEVGEIESKITIR